MLAGSHRNAWPDDTGTGGRTNRNTQRFQSLLWSNRITPSMSGCGACLDNAVVERFFGSLKNEWLLNVYHLTRESMKTDVEKYIKYYNSVRLHTSLNDMSPIEFESVRKKCAA